MRETQNFSTSAHQERDDPQESLHVGVRPDYHISRYWGAFTSLAVARYLLRGPLYALGKVKSWLDRAWMGTDRLAGKLYEDVCGLYTKHSADEAKAKASWFLSGHDIGDEKAEELLNTFPSTTKDEFVNATRSTLRKHLFEHRFSTALGIGSLAYTTSHIGFSIREMTRLYAETVAYELGKDPRSVSFSDLHRSDNAIIRNGVENLTLLNGKRLFGDVMFFGRELGRLGRWFAPLKVLKSVPFEDIGLGIKGFFLFRDIRNRQPTVYESIVTFVDKNVNPLQGLGEDIQSGDLIDIFQRYAADTNPAILFKDTETHNGHLHRASMQVAFDRMAKLMNDTYRYKALSAAQPAKAVFPLPKFLYLLGHGLIDPRNPDQTMAYVEVANRYGMEDVKHLQKDLSHGATLTAAMRRYPDTPVSAMLDIANERRQEQETVPVGLKPDTPTNLVKASLVAARVDISAEPARVALN